MGIVAAIVDQREPEWVRVLKFGGALTAISLLDAGDLLATCEDGTLVAVERKTPDDFLNSIRDDRLWSQLAGIRQLTRWAYLLITGELRNGPDGKVLTDSRGTGWNWASVQGALVSAQEMGVFVVQCAGDRDYEAAVLRLVARDHQLEMPVLPAREPRLLSEAERILLSLPGIGPERIGALLDYCGNAANALTYLTDPAATAAVPGVGAGTRRAVRRALGLREDETLATVIAETGQLTTEERKIAWARLKH